MERPHGKTARNRMKTFLHFCAVAGGFAEPATQVTNRELAVLRRHCAGARVAVEIGCFEGRTTAFLARHVSGTVYTIDPFPPGRLGVPYGKLIASRYLARHRIANVRFIVGLSHQVAGDFHESIDFLFIDGDHTLSAVERDWKDWLPKVRTNGIVAAHDCRTAVNSPGRLGSMEFYDFQLTRMPEIEEIDSIDSLAVFRKR